MQHATIQDPRATALPVFKPCENGNASDPLIRGDVVEYELSAGYPGISVVDGTVDDPLVAGVVIGQGFDYSNITAGDFGILCVSGFCDRVTTDGSVDAGEILVAAASAVAKGSTTLVIGALGVALATDVSTDCAASVIRGLL